MASAWLTYKRPDPKPQARDHRVQGCVSALRIINCSWNNKGDKTNSLRSNRAVLMYVAKYATATHNWTLLNLFMLSVGIFTASSKELFLFPLFETSSRTVLAKSCLTYKIDGGFQSLPTQEP